MHGVVNLDVRGRCSSKGIDHTGNTCASDGQTCCILLHGCADMIAKGLVWPDLLPMGDAAWQS